MAVFPCLHRPVSQVSTAIDGDDDNEEEEEEEGRGGGGGKTLCVLCVLMFMYYYTVGYFTCIFCAVVRQISVLFIDNKDSVF